MRSNHAGLLLCPVPHPGSLAFGRRGKPLPQDRAHRVPPGSSLLERLRRCSAHGPHGLHGGHRSGDDPREQYFAKSGAPVTWNDGGPQIPNFYHALEPVPRGEIVAYEHCDAYTYVAADLTRACSSVRDDPATKQRTRSAKVREITRQFAYVRGNPEFLVIYDRVSATDAALPKTWVLHLQDEPEVLAAGGSPQVAKEGLGFKSYQGAEGLLSRVASRDGKYWTTAERGAVGIRTLLPKDAQITKRGGKGFELRGKSVHWSWWLRLGVESGRRSTCCTGRQAGTVCPSTSSSPRGSLTPKSKVPSGSRAVRPLATVVRRSNRPRSRRRRDTA